MLAPQRLSHKRGSTLCDPKSCDLKLETYVLDMALESLETRALRSFADQIDEQIQETACKTQMSEAFGKLFSIRFDLEACGWVPGCR